MSWRRSLIAAAFILIAGQAKAMLPQQVLDNDYKNCLAGSQDPQRIAFCACVRQTTSGWSLDTYADAATQVANAKPGQAPSGPLAALAQQCMARISR